MKFTVLSPDGIPIWPDLYNTQAEAQAALAKWCKRFERQGYYAAVDGRIALDELPHRCQIVREERRHGKQ
jgi:hypothetical protein